MSSSSFSGGTAKAVHLPSFEFVPEEGHAVFERGTFNLLAMSAIPLGLGCIRKRLSAIRARNALFMKYLAEQLPVIRYNDAMAGRMVESWGPELEKRGAALPLLFSKPDGRPENYHFIVWAAGRQKIAVRGWVIQFIKMIQLMNP
jgi:hypothetical protein